MFNGIFPSFFFLSVSMPSRYFRWVHLCSLPTILAFSQSISCAQVVECLARPPSPSFILLDALSRSPASTSRFVSLTLSWCSFSLLSHFLSVSPVYPYLWHLQGMSYTRLVFFFPSGVFALVTRSRTLFSVLFTIGKLCFLAILLY